VLGSRFLLKIAITSLAPLGICGRYSGMLSLDVVYVCGDPGYDERVLLCIDYSAERKKIFRNIIAVYICLLAKHVSLVFC
jgi:hypothetical protein